MARGAGVSWEGHTHFGWPWSNYGRAPDIFVADERGLVLGSKLGRLDLRSVVVLWIERSGMFPCLWKGIMIHHRNPAYPKRIGFVPRSGPETEILNELEKLGYSILP